MKFKAKPVDLETGGKSIVILNRQDMDVLGLHPMDRLSINFKNSYEIAIIDVSDKFVKPGEIATNYEISKNLGLKYGDAVEVTTVGTPDSVEYIREKIRGENLSLRKMRSIVNDVVKKNLTEIELSSFVTALETKGISIDEAENLSIAMIESGKKFKVPGKIIVDKHSIGGIPGDKTSMILVPIIAAAGYIIPKTSSRAITSPAGTADRMEVLAPVDLTTDEILKVIKKTNACLVWGGAVDLAPADDIFIKIEYPLGIDPLLLPSIMSKKKAVGAKYLVIDIPTGRGAKIKTIGQANSLSENFIQLGKRMGMNVSCAITFGEQPLGHAIGPALEAREALNTLMNRGPHDVVEKATQVSGILFETIKGNSGQKAALNLLRSGKAYKKMKQIIEAQGGNPNVKPSDIAIGKNKLEIKSNRDGRVLWIKNAELASIARETGAPKDKGAGITLDVKMGDPVKKGQRVMTLYSNNTTRLSEAYRHVVELEPMIIGKSHEERMLLDRVPRKDVHKRIVILER